MVSFSWEEWLVIAASVAMGGLVKGVTGVGLPLVAVPVLAGFIGVEPAVVILVIPAVVLNAYQVVVHRDEAAALPEWWRLIAAGVPGAALGAAVLYTASERVLAGTLGLWIFVYLAFRLAHPRFNLSLAARMRWSPLVGAVAGALQAATGISAPVVAAYAHSLGLRPSAYVFAVSVPFCAFATAHLTVLVLAGLYDAETLARSLFAVVPAVAAILLGARLRALVSPGVFELLIRGLLAVMAVRLLYTAWLPD